MQLASLVGASRSASPAAGSLLLPSCSTLVALPYRAEVERYRAETVAAANDDRTQQLRALSVDLTAVEEQVRGVLIECAVHARSSRHNWCLAP